MRKNPFKQTRLVENVQGKDRFAHAISGPIQVDRQSVSDADSTTSVRWHPEEGAVCLHFHADVRMVGFRPKDAALLARQLMSAAVQGGLPLDQAFPVLNMAEETVETAEADE